MRNIFDQYTQPENKLTHAFVCTLAEDKKLLKNFIDKFVTKEKINVNNLKIIEQTLPEYDEDEISGSLPDAMFYDEEAGIAIVFENKIADILTLDQLTRHEKNIRRYKFEKVIFVTISVNISDEVFKGWKHLTWKQLYQWLYSEPSKSIWKEKFLDYIQIMERKLMEQEYLTNGPLTTYSGIHFGSDRPLSYIEGKQTVRHLGIIFRENRKLFKDIPLNFNHPGRHSITKVVKPLVLWDYIPFVASDKSSKFNNAPHCTFGIHEQKVDATLTMPDSIKTTYKDRIRNISFEDYRDALEDILKNLNKNLPKSEGIKPIIKVVQRHYKSQKSAPTVDGITEFDLRTAFSDRTGKVKYYDGWLRLSYDLLQEQVRSGSANIQFQIGVSFYYDKCQQLKSSDSYKLFINTWNSLKPFVKLVTN